MGRIKLGLVGVGKIARDQHLPVIANSPDFKLAAVASRNASVSGVLSYRTLRDMLDARPEIEAVAICTPPGPRDLDARLALEAGLHVLLEKPPAASVNAARELAELATRSTLCMSWHSRHAPAVQPAKRWLADKTLRGVLIEWREDIRVWHPGQDWILEAGGLGVFDPGINALSILTALVSDRVVMETAYLGVPAERQAPLTASLDLRIGRTLRGSAIFDFLQTGPQTWTIRLETDQGTLTLMDGGARARVDGAELDLQADAHHEYRGVYQQFATCIRTETNDCDLRPIEIVADAFLLGQVDRLPAFTF